MQGGNPSLMTVYIKQLIQKYSWRRTSPGNPELLTNDQVLRTIELNKAEKEFVKQATDGIEMISIDGIVGFIK